MRHGRGVAVNGVLPGEREIESNSGCPSWCSRHVYRWGESRIGGGTVQVA